VNSTIGTSIPIHLIIPICGNFSKKWGLGCVSVRSTLTHPKFPPELLRSYNLCNGLFRYIILVMSDLSPTQEQLTSEILDLRQKLAAFEDAARDHLKTDEAQKEAMLTTTRQLEQQLRESQMLLQISQTLASSLELSTTLQDIVDAAAVLIEKADRAVIHLLDDNQTFLHSVAVAGPDKRPVSQGLNFNAGEGIAGIALASGRTISVADAPTDPRYIRGEEQEGRVRSLLVAPVKTTQMNMGTLSVHSSKSGVFTSSDEHLLTILGTQAALALSQAQLFETTQGRLKEINALYGITQGIIEAFDVDTVLRQTVGLLQEYFHFYHVQIFMYDPGSDHLELRQGTGAAGVKMRSRRIRQPVEKGIVGHVAVSGQAFVTNNVKDALFYEPNPLLPETSAELVVPLRAGDRRNPGDRILGVLDIHHKAPRVFTDHDVRLMTTIAGQVAVAVEKISINADLQAALRHEQSVRAQLVQSEKLAALGRIVASVAHELNNPLQAIQNALYLIRVSEQLDDQSQDDLKVALSEASRMGELISRLRETYRPTTKEEFRFESINVIFNEVQKLISGHLAHNNITYQFEPDPNLPLIPIIRDQIKQVILNMCLNGVEAMPNGGTLKLSTHYASKKSQVNFKISDTGAGIPEDVLPYIFDPFVTTKEIGTGLGLAITYDIVRRHNGRIEVDSEMGKGSHFTVWLPLQQT
jgi:signal transduction histidine kinase